ncbi:hypothetical protein ACFE04_000317 [Oxalis oulophora]
MLIIYEEEDQSSLFVGTTASTNEFKPTNLKMVSGSECVAAWDEVKELSAAANVDLNDWNRQLVRHLHLGCVELIYEKILLVKEDTGNNDALQLVSNEVAVNQDDVICCKKEKNVFRAVTVELAKLRNGVQEMINVVNDKNGNTTGWSGYGSR